VLDQRGKLLRAALGFAGLSRSLSARRTWLHCEKHALSDRWQGDRSCLAEFLIGDVPVDALYVFRGDKFVRVSPYFDSGYFGRLVAIFKERYGPPTTSSGDALAWSGEKVNISVDRRGGRTGGAAWLTTVAEMKESKRLRDEQTKGAAKGLSR
jgi:hypothetical protein